MNRQDYLRMLEEGFAQTRDVLGDGGPNTRLDFLGDHIFNFTTYDSAMSELFATKALEVCAAVSDRRTFEYIEDAEQYRWYLVMVNMPFFADKLEWGTSVRGAWWGEPPHERIKFTSCGLWLNGEQLHETMEFTAEQWQDFVAAVREFAAGSKEHNVL